MPPENFLGDWVDGHERAPETPGVRGLVEAGREGIPRPTGRRAFGADDRVALFLFADQRVEHPPSRAIHFQKLPGAIDSGTTISSRSSPLAASSTLHERSSPK